MDIRKLMKQLFVHGTKRNIFHDFANRCMTLTMKTTVLLRIIIATGGYIWMPQYILEFEMALIIGHVWM